MTRRSLLWIGAGVLGLLILIALQQLLYPLSEGSRYRYVRAFGQDTLNRPVGIALSGGRVYVTDTDNDRMAVFTPEGNLLGTGGSQGSATGQFRRPMHMSRGPEGNLYVADMLNHRVQKFSPSGKFLRVYGSKGTGRGEFRQPSGVAVDSEGNLYVTEFMNQRVQKLSPEGNFLRQWGHTGVKGYFRYTYFNYPTDVAVAPGGSWLVTDAYNERVKRYGSDGTLQSVWGGLFGLNIPGPFRGWFNVATGIGLSPEGDRVFVADFFNHRVQVMGSGGSFYMLFGEKGDGPGQMTLPTDVAVREDGTVFVVDYGNNRIQVWRPSE